MFHLAWLAQVPDDRKSRLSQILDFDWLSFVPVEVARWGFLVLFLGIAFLILWIPADYIFEGTKKRHWWCDLRLWAIGVLAMLFFTYAAL